MIRPVLVFPNVRPSPALPLYKDSDGMLSAVADVIEDFATRGLIERGAPCRVIAFDEEAQITTHHFLVALGGTYVVDVTMCHDFQFPRAPPESEVWLKLAKCQWCGYALPSFEPHPLECVPCGHARATK